MMATPLVGCVRSAWPGVRLDWAVGGHSRAAVEGVPLVDGVVDATGCMRGELSLRRVFGAITALRRGHYELALVPDRSPLAALIPRLGGVPRRVGLDSAGRGRLHTLRVPLRPDDPRHETEIYLDLARALGLADVESVDRRPVFAPSDEQRTRARMMLEGDDALVGEPAHRSRAVRSQEQRSSHSGSLEWSGLRVAIHPGGGENPGMRMVEKRWPAERFGDLAVRCSLRGASIVVVGGPGDRAAGERVLAGQEVRGLSCVGRCDLGTTAALIESCDVFVGNDSGLAHIAAAVGTPVVAIFGPTSPRRYGPVAGAGMVVTPPGGAAPPGSLYVGAAPAHAVDRIEVEAVWRALEHQLGRAGGTAGISAG